MGYLSIGSNNEFRSISNEENSQGEETTAEYEGKVILVCRAGAKATLFKMVSLVLHS